MIKAEENFDQVSETESESSTDSTNPFNVYVEMYKKSATGPANGKLTQLNTRSSNQSTPENSKAPNCQNLPFSQSSQNDLQQQQTDQVKINQNPNTSDEFHSLNDQYHLQYNLIKEVREDLSYWSIKVKSLFKHLQNSELETQLSMAQLQLEEKRKSGKAQLKQDLGEVKKELKALLAENENLNAQISQRDHQIQDLIFQKIELDKSVAEIKDEIENGTKWREEREREKEQGEFEQALKMLYGGMDFMKLTELAMKVQSQIQCLNLDSNQKLSDQQISNEN